jgi:hypothetical protein
MRLTIHCTSPASSKDMLTHPHKPGSIPTWINSTPSIGTQLQRAITWAQRKRNAPCIDPVVMDKNKRTSQCCQGMEIVNRDPVSWSIKGACALGGATGNDERGVGISGVGEDMHTRSQMMN